MRRRSTTKRSHDSKAEYRRLQSRINATYLDKFHSRIVTAFFDSKSAEWRTGQDRLLGDVATHQAANQTCIEEGVQLLKLATTRASCSKGREPGRNGGC